MKTNHLSKSVASNELNWSFDFPIFPRNVLFALQSPNRSRWKRQAKRRSLLLCNAPPPPGTDFFKEYLLRRLGKYLLHSIFIVHVGLIWFWLQSDSTFLLDDRRQMGDCSWIQKEEEDLWRKCENWFFFSNKKWKLLQLTSPLCIHYCFSGSQEVSALRELLENIELFSNVYARKLPTPGSL